MDAEIIQITDEEKTRLEELETVIERNIKGFMQVGMALKVIREQKLYRVKNYPDWPTYCREVWDLGRVYAEYQIRASDVVGVLVQKSHNCDSFEILPANEAQVRPLVPFEADLQRKLWQDAIDHARAENSGRVTAAIVNKVVREYTAQKNREVIDSLLPEPDVGDELFRMSAQFDKGLRGFLEQVLEAVNTNFRTTSRDAVLAAIESIRNLIEPVNHE